MVFEKLLSFTIGPRLSASLYPSSSSHKAATPVHLGSPAGASPVGHEGSAGPCPAAAAHQCRWGLAGMGSLAGRGLAAGHEGSARRRPPPNTSSRGGSPALHEGSAAPRPRRPEMEPKLRPLPPDLEGMELASAMEPHRIASAMEPLVEARTTRSRCISSEMG